MDAQPSLPRELRESLRSARADADRLVLWNLWELQQWVEATRSRGLAFLALLARRPAELRRHLEPVAAEFGMAWEIGDAAARPAVLVLASQEGHCVNDLLYRWQTGWLPVEVVGVASNHETLKPLVDRYDVPFHHLPVTRENRAEAEGALLSLVAASGAELVVLARYMQILSDRVCSPLGDRLINIHHSFLPSFRGAGPYRQAHERGVKLIGATAHYVTVDLDEGPSRTSPGSTTR